MTADTNIVFSTLRLLGFSISINNRYQFPFFFAFVRLNKFPIHYTGHFGLYLRLRYHVD
jgi:hypothetical protein